MPLLEFVVNLKILQLESPLRGGLLNLDCEIEVSTSSGAKFLGRHLLSILYYKTAEASKKLGLQRA